MGNREIGLRIAGARRDAGMTAKELARRVQVAASTITRYEKGEIDNIKMPVISEIARQLRVNPMWIIGRSSHKHTDDMIKDWDVASYAEPSPARKKTDFATRLREALHMCGMKPIELSELTGISRGSISSYLSARWTPKQNNIYLIARTLNVSEAWLMGYDVSMDRADTTIDLKAALQNADVLFYGDRHKITPAERQQVEKILAAVLAEEDDET